jgi:hypothetical protein
MVDDETPSDRDFRDRWLTRSSGAATLTFWASKEVRRMAFAGEDETALREVLSSASC